MGKQNKFKFSTKIEKDNVHIFLTYNDFDFIEGTAVINWYLDFNFKNNNGVEIIPVIETVTLHLNKFVFNKIEHEEVTLTHKNIQVEPESLTVFDVNKLYYPARVEYDYIKNSATVYL